MSNKSKKISDSAVSEKWQQIKSIFLDALEIEEPRREKFLIEICGDDSELRNEVEKLLAAHFKSENFIEKPVAEINSLFQTTVNQKVPQRFGNYKIIRQIGRGGMGAVFLAARADDQFNKRVAIKVLRRGVDTEDVLRRFRQERQILAALEHPFIARLLDGGMSEDGLPYLVMEYVEGIALDRYCDEHNFSTEERLEIFRKVCSAVQYAHQNLVVHRDLKPSNILVTEDGEPKLLDFGIAKFLNPELSAQTIAPTATFVRLMTPEYASPEQIRGRNITTASDIYSLGVILYKLLTGHAPYQFENTSPQEIERVVCETEPVRPSSFVLSHSQNHTTQPNEQRTKDKGQRTNSLKGDLDNIVLKALRKEPERRYKSVEKFSEDIERYLKGLPVSARPNTFSYRAGKFIKRHKVGVAAAALILLSLIGGIAIAAWQADVARAERDRAQAAQIKAERISQFLSAALTYSDPSAAVAGTKNRRDATINEMLDDFAPRIETELAEQPDVRAFLQRTVGLAYISQLRFAEAERYLNAALDTHLKIYGENHQETAYTLSGMASLQYWKGDITAAEKTLEKVIAIYRSQPPTEQVHIRVFVAALVLLGDYYWTRGDYKAAESAYSEGLDFASQLQGRDRKFVADSKVNLGSNRFAQGRLDEATTLLREAITEYRILPHTPYELPTALNFLGQVLIWKNEFDEALTVLRESETISLEVLGENNYSYARSLWLQVYALCFKGDCAAAEKPLNKTEEVSNRYFPDNKAIKGNNCDARNIFLTRTGRAAQGETFGRQSVELYQTSTSRGSNSITLARMHLAESLTAQKKYQEAERVLQEAYKDASEMQGAEHWRTKDVEKQLSALYKIWKKPG